MGWDLIDDAKRDGITAVQNAQDAAAGRNGKNDPLNNDMQLGGEANGAQNDAERFKGLANGAANTAAPGTNWRGGNAYNSYADSSRNGTQDALSLMRDRANGIHTASDAMANRGNALATAGQGAMIRSGRGAGALAGAGAQTAGIASRMHTDNANNIRVTNAADTAQAQQQLAQGYGQQRAQDASQQHILDARAQYVADLSMRQRGLNDAGQMGYERQAFGANMSGLKGEEALNDAQYADWAQRSNQHEAVAGMDQANAMKYGGAALNGLGQGAGYAYSQGGADPGYDYSDPSNTDINRVNPYTNSDQRVKSDIKDESAAAQYARKVHEILSTKEGSKQFGETLVPTGAPAATERLKERIAASDTGKRLDGAHKATASGLGGFTQGTADKFLEATKGWGTGGDDSKAGYVERVSRAIQKKSNDARHATGADKYDAQPEDAGELGRMPTKGSVKGLLEAQAAKEERERQAELAGMDQSYMARYVREVQAHRDSHGGADPRAMNDNPVEIATESGPMTDSYGRTHKMVEKYGENFYPGFKKDDPTRKDPPKGGDVFANGKWSKAPDPVNPLEQKRLEYEAFVKAHQQAEPTPEAMPAPRPPSASMEMLDHVKPVSFDYKPGFGGPGRHYGVLAQDLEKSPMGASLVHQGPDGVRKVDVAKASMANMAANADLHERVKVLEGGVDKSAQKRERQEGVAPEPTPEPLPAPPPPQDGLVASSAPKQFNSPKRDSRTALTEPLPAGKKGGGFLYSDEVVKDDIRREGIDPKTAYTSRVHELMAMADAGHPEAPRKLLRVEREGERLGLNKAHSSRGDYDSEDQVLGVDKRLMGGVVPGEVKFEDEEDPNDRTLRTLDREQSPQVDPEGWTVAPNKTEAYAAKVRGNLFAGPMASGYEMSKDAPPAPSSPEGRAAYANKVMGPSGAAPRKAVRQEADIAAENKKYDDDVAKFMADKAAAPQAPPMMGIGRKEVAGSNPNVPEGMMIGPNGGLMPKPAEPTAAEPPAANPADVVTGKAREPVSVVHGDERDMSRESAEPAQRQVPRTWGGGSDQNYGANILKLEDARDAQATARGNKILENNRGDASVEEGNAGTAAGEAGDRAKDAHDDVLRIHEEANRRIQEFDTDARALANYHEDPARFWNSRSTGQQVAGILGVIIGGFAAGLHGGRNAALDQMNRAQDLDLQAQQHEYAARKDSVEAKRSAFGMAMEKYKDVAIATSVVRLAQIDRTSAMANAAASHHKGTESENDNLRLQQDLLDRRTKTLTDLQKAQQAAAAAAANARAAAIAKQDAADDKAYTDYHHDATLAKPDDNGFVAPVKSRAQFLNELHGGDITQHTGGAPGEKPKSKYEQEKTTIDIDGKERPALNKTVAEDWGKYYGVRAEAQRLYAVLQRTKAHGVFGGSPGEYNAAAKKLLEVMPRIYEFNRGPSEAQVHTTFGPDSFPEFVHMWSPALRHRANLAINDLGETLKTIDGSMRLKTFGTHPNPNTDAGQGPTDDFQKAGK